MSFIGGKIKLNSKNKGLKWLIGGALIALYITILWFSRVPYFFWRGMTGSEFFYSFFIVLYTGSMLIMVWYATYKIYSSNRSNH